MKDFIKGLLLRIKTAIKPFLRVQMIISCFIPFCVVTLPAYVLPVIGLIAHNAAITAVGTTWLGIIHLPICHESIVIIPIGLFIHTKLFPNDKITRYRLLRLWVQAKRDVKAVKERLKRLTKRGKRNILMADKKKYTSPTVDIEETSNGANTRLPFGLCEKYGIPINKDWTPRDAWNALKSKTGITPDKAYEDLRREDEKKRKKVKGKFEDRDEIDENAENVKKSVDKLMENSRNIVQEKHRQALRENIEYGTLEMQKLTADLFVNDGFGIDVKKIKTSEYSPQFNKVTINPYDLDYDFTHIEAKGQAVYHECWHAIDANYGAYGLFKPTDESISFKELAGEIIAAKEKEKLSASYVLSTGKTFHETLKEELKTKTKADFKNELKPYLTDRQIENNAALFLSQDKKIALTDLSDIYSGATRDPGGLVGIGHKKAYWLESDYHISSETFAEIASAKATNKESYNIVSRVLPNTVKAFEEIFQKLKKGELKPNERPKYAR